MEKGCLFQIQKWRNSSFTTRPHPVRYHRHRPHHFRRFYGKTTMIAFLTIVSITMNSLLISPCSAQGLISENGFEDESRRMARGAARGSSGSPCMPEEYLTPVRAAFPKLIPNFNSRSLTIQLKTDLRIQIGPEDPSLVPFLQSYYSTALKQIAAARSSTLSSQEGKEIYSAMFLYFNTEYTRFLARIGVPLTCISHFLGVVDTQAISQLQQLTTTLQKRYLPQTSRDGGFKCLFAEGLSGQEIMNMLAIPNPDTFFPSEYEEDPPQDAAACEQIILYMKDGSVLAKMPNLNIDRRELAIPYLTSPLRLGQLDVPHQIGQYITTALNCLEDVGQRWNFTCRVVEWMKNDVLYHIVRTPVCLPGFGGILPFILSVQDYSETLRSTLMTSSTLRTTSISSNASIAVNPELDQVVSVVSHLKVRKRRSIDSHSPRFDKKEKRKRKKVKRKRSHHHGKSHQRSQTVQHSTKGQGPASYTQREQVQTSWSNQQDKMSYNSPEQQNQWPTNQGSTYQQSQGQWDGSQQQGQIVQTHEYHGRHEEEKKKYDEELLHLYNKINDHFQHNHMRISRLDLLRDEGPRAKAMAFPPIYFHHTTIRPHPRKHYEPLPTTTTTTTTPRPTTTTTTRPPDLPPMYNAVPIGPLKINAEVYMDENRFNKPVQVVVSGKKVDAQLNVIPKNHVSMSGDVVHFQENPEVSSHLHPVFDFNMRHHPPLKTNHITRPLNIRKHLLYRKQSRDNRPHNPIDDAINSGFQSVSNMAKSILPSVFGKPATPRPLPKMHKFHPVSPDAYKSRNPPRYQPHQQQAVARPSVGKGHHLNAIERGLDDLLRTDDEIPR